MSEIGINIYFFDFLRSMLSHFPTDVCKNFLENLLEYECNLQNDSKVHMSCIKT